MVVASQGDRSGLMADGVIEISLDVLVRGDATTVTGGPAESAETVEVDGILLRAPA